jgi:hypothetical protein
LVSTPFDELVCSLEEHLMAKIFIDTDLRSIGIEGQAALVPTSLMWGETLITNDVITMKNKPPNSAPSRNVHEIERQKLWTIRKLIQQKKLHLCNYWGLEWEVNANTATKSYHIGMFDQLSQCELALNALPPELVGVWSFQSELKLVDVVKKFLAIDGETFMKFVEPRSNEVPLFWHHQFSNISRLRFLTSHNCHHADALHLWICEINNIDYFVTADNSFNNFMSKTLHTTSSVHIISPTELLLDLNEFVVPFPAEKVPFALSILDLDD